MSRNLERKCSSESFTKATWTLEAIYGKASAAHLQPCNITHNTLLWYHLRRYSMLQYFVDPQGNNQARSQ